MRSVNIFVKIDYWFNNEKFPLTNGRDVNIWILGSKCYFIWKRELMIEINNNVPVHEFIKNCAYFNVKQSKCLFFFLSFTRKYLYQIRIIFELETILVFKNQLIDLIISWL